MDACGLGSVAGHLTNFPPGLLPPFSVELPPFLSGPSRESVMICRAAIYIFYHIWFCKASKLHRNAKLPAVPKPSFTYSVDAQQGYNGGIQSTRKVPQGISWRACSWG